MFGRGTSVRPEYVLELKVDPEKTERDRLIGQCCDYSCNWVTWAVVIGMPESRVKELERLLEEKSLHYIEVIPFYEDDDDDEDDEGDEEDDDEGY